MDLESIPGVGAKTAAALAEAEGIETALERVDVAAIAAVSGISPARAVRIARGAIRKRHGDDSRLLASDHSRAIHRDLLDLLKSYTVTRYGAHRFETFYPSAHPDRIAEVTELVDRALDREFDSSVATPLADVSPVVDRGSVTVRDRCVATTDAETYSRARTALPELSVELVDDARGLADLARGYSTVIALDETFVGVEVDGDVRVEPDALDQPIDIVPERPLAFFAANRDSIRAAAAVHRAANIEPPCDLDSLDGALSSLGEDGSVVDDPELERLKTALDDLETAVAFAERAGTDKLRTAIDERAVTIDGADLLSLAERGAGVDTILSRELADEFDAAVTAAREHLIDALALVDDEVELANRAFSDEPTFPIERDDASVDRLRETLVARRDRLATTRKCELAATLADHRIAAEHLIYAALELDVEIAIARFVEEYSASIATFDGTGISITGGRSPLLDEDPAEIEPVDYTITGVTLLTGVNSGGKTATLDLIAAVVILAHMGLPVPATEVRLQRFETIHYYAKTQGTLDAGAFESTLRTFAELTDGDAGTLVLVDELESITEPGAGARIMAGILEALVEVDATAVFVSHLADQILAAADVDLTVDGIEATGLVDGNLLVDRSPRRGHLARSTPELIVEKLADEHDAPIYRQLLEKFE